MVIKDKIGRRRYIIAKKSEEIKKIIEEIKKIDPSAKLILKTENFMLLRCKHWFKDEVIKKLNAMGIKTYKTTGTIKKAKKIIDGLNP